MVVPKLWISLQWKIHVFNVIHLSRNFGHQEALSAGLAFANGFCVVVLDADLQDSLETVGLFSKNGLPGVDIVYAIRKNRKEGILKRASYTVFYRIYKLLANSNVPLDSGDFCLIDRKVLDVLNHLPEKIRFVRDYAIGPDLNNVGLNVTDMSVNTEFLNTHLLN